MNRLDDNTLEKKAFEDWSVIIRSRVSVFDVNLKEIWQYRYLIYLFVRRDFVAKVKQTVLGPIWFIIQPLLTTVMFAIVFGKIAKIPTDGLPKMLFYMSGVVSWTYFSNCLNATSTTFISNANIFGKVYFPRLSIPISIVISNLINFSIQFLFLLSLIFFFRVRGTQVNPNIFVLIIPFLIILMAGLGLGFGIIVSSLTTRYRDFNYLVSFGTQLWMYATPVVYPASMLPEKYKIFVMVNPLAPIIETFRYALLGAGTVSFVYLVYSLCFTAAVLFIGILVFNKVGKTFMDTV